MPTSSPTDASKHFQPHTCGREEQASSITGLITAEQLRLGQDLRWATRLPTRTHWGSPP